MGVEGGERDCSNASCRAVGVGGFRFSRPPSLLSPSPRYPCNSPVHASTVLFRAPLTPLPCQSPSPIPLEYRGSPRAGPGPTAARLADSRRRPIAHSRLNLPASIAFSTVSGVDTQTQPGFLASSQPSKIATRRVLAGIPGCWANAGRLMY